MKILLTNAQMRASDEYTINVLGVSGEELMARAGSAIAEEVEKIIEEKFGPDASVVVVCGNGNNGGDGFVCARKLKEGGRNVAVYAFGGRLSPDCEREKQRYDGAYSQTVCADIVVDCIFGTGLTRPVGGEYATVIEQINRSGAFVVAADIPSGLNGDNGQIMGAAVNASLTVAVAEYKAGMFLGDGPDFCGAIVKKDIGITARGYCARVYEKEDIAVFYPPRKRNSHKGTYGSANLIAGSEQYRGAAALSTEAALRSGCGYVKLTSCNAVKNSLVAAYPQVIYLDQADFTSQAIAVGMGCGKSRALYDTIENLLKNYRGKLIVDADGLNVLSEYGTDALKVKNCDVLVTPHVKEFSRLTGLSVADILSDPVAHAQNFAAEHKITVLLKSACSVITDGINTAVNVRGTTALSKGGSGDILSGLVCGNAARGLDLFEAAVASSFVLGVSAEICSGEQTDYCVTAKDLLKNLPKSVKRLTP